jgi:hypothetical protein
MTVEAGVEGNEAEIYLGAFGSEVYKAEMAS